MKIIDVILEEIGIKTQEIDVLLKDVVENLLHYFVTVHSTYQVLKIPSELINLLFLAEKEKIIFIGTQFHSYGKLYDVSIIVSDKKFNNYYLICFSNSDDETYTKVIRIVNDYYLGVNPL